MFLLLKGYFTATQETKLTPAPRVRKVTWEYRLHRTDNILHQPKPSQINAIQSKEISLNIRPSLLRKNVSNALQVPKVIHQVWKTLDVPSSVTPWIRTWFDYNPTFQYMMWTDKTVETFLEKKYPNFLSKFSALNSDIRRADIIRYFILYQFGGLYIDLDMEALQPINDIITNHYCMLSQEPREHAIILHKRTRGLISNALMLCRPKHPFMRFVIKYFTETDVGVLNSLTPELSTGLFVLDKLYREYITKYVANKIENSVDVPRPQTFMPSFDVHQNLRLATECQDALKSNTSLPAVLDMCQDLKERGFQNRPTLPSSYSDHKWTHVFQEDRHGLAKDMGVDVKSIARNFKDVLVGII